MVRLYTTNTKGYPLRFKFWSMSLWLNPKLHASNFRLRALHFKI